MKLKIRETETIETANCNCSERRTKMSSTTRDRSSSGSAGSARKRRRPKKRSRSHHAQIGSSSEPGPDGATQQRVVYPSGTVYEGHMLDGMRHGQGSCIDENGNHFRGTWVRDEASG